ncbi:hypothetical protein IWX91DRAFT_324653 [Phyllosticta citricarpa]
MDEYSQLSAGDEAFDPGLASRWPADARSPPQSLASFGIVDCVVFDGCAALHSTALPASALIPSPNASRGLLTAALTLKLLACGVLLHLKHKPASFSPIPLRRLCVQPASSLGVSFLVWGAYYYMYLLTAKPS